MENVGLRGIGQQFEHLRRDRGIEIGDQQRDHLRMFLFDHRRDVGRFEPGEQIDRARILGRGDPGEHAIGLFGTERAVHHRSDARARIEADRGPRPGVADEIVEHALHLGLADIGDREHRAAELADFLGIELLQDRGGFFLADQHHQHRGALDAAEGFDRGVHHCASDLIMSRTASAARVGLSRVKPRTSPTRSS